MLSVAARSHPTLASQGINKQKKKLVCPKNDMPAEVDVGFADRHRQAVWN
jgi:hypothetical protein